MKRIFLLLALYCLLSTTTLVFAVEATPYNLLAPIPLSGGNAPTPTTTAGPYLKGIFTLIIAIAGGLAVIKIIFGGIKYMSTDAFMGKNEAKDTIQNAIWGLLLAISAWLILSTINPDLVKFNLKIPSQAAPSAGAVGAGTGGVDITGAGGSPLSHQSALDRFTAVGVTVAGAITLEGLREGVIDEIVRLNGACLSSDINCKIIITSATGGQHDTTVQPVCNHKNGYKVDLRSNGNGTTLTKYIKNNYRRFPNRGNDGAEMYQSPSGVFYALESNPPHWDVTKC